MKALILTDSGAYASLGGPVLQRACTHAAGPYNYQDIDIVGRAYYSNNPLRRFPGLWRPSKLLCHRVQPEPSGGKG